jgi:hypothetical protein
METPAISTVLGVLAEALTPVERWQAARRFTGDFTIERWLVFTGVIAVVILTALLLWVTFARYIQGRKSASRLFKEYADQRGLSERERHILRHLAIKAGLKEDESVFTMVDAFDRGATKAIEESLDQQRAATKSRRLKGELVSLREKLGFGKGPLSATGLAGSKRVSSRQIPAGKQIQVKPRGANDSELINATVVENAEHELSVKLSEAAEVAFSEAWCVHYYSGSSVWEFDTSIVRFDGSVLVLNHNDEVRFINCRRFLRAPVRRSALIAPFPFTRTVPASNGSETVQAGDAGDEAQASLPPFAGPEFAPAVVTELGGVGLRLETSLRLELGDRVVVIFTLSGEDSELTHADGSTTMLRIVQETAEVRRVQAAENGFLISVELTGLNDSQIDELVHATNKVLQEACAPDRSAPAYAGAGPALTKSSALEGA